MKVQEIDSHEHAEKEAKSKEAERTVASTTRTRKQRRRVLLRFAVVFLVIAALLFGIPYYLHSRSHESTDDAFIDGHIIAISPRVSGHVAQVYVTDNQWVRKGDRLVDLDPADFQVRVAAAEAALTAAQASQRTGSVGVDLTTIATSADLDGARANVAAAKAAVEAAKAQAGAARSLHDQAKAQVAIAAAALDQARAEVGSAAAEHRRDAEDLKRYRKMETARIISGRDVDHAVAAEQATAANLTAAEKAVETHRSMLVQARAALKTAADNLRRAKAQVAASQAQFQQAASRLAAAQSAPKQVEQSRSRAAVLLAEVDKAKAGAAQARLNLSYTHITAPADGYVTKRAVEPGQFVQMGQSLLAIVPKSVWVTANFKETQLTHMKPGQPVEIRVDAYPDVILRGHVDSIQRGTGSRFSLLPPENATGNYIKVVQRVPVKIIFDATEELDRVLLAPGLSVVPEVDISAEGSRVEKKKGVARSQ